MILASFLFPLPRRQLGFCIRLLGCLSLPLESPWGGGVCLSVGRHLAPRAVRRCVLVLALLLCIWSFSATGVLLAFASFTFQEVQEHTDQIWKFQRHDLIEEYQGRPPAPPPFILLSHLHLFIKRVILRIPAKRHKQLSEPPSALPECLSSGVLGPHVGLGWLW